MMLERNAEIAELKQRRHKRRVGFRGSPLERLAQDPVGAGRIEN
jgi:hypothetical protein